MSLSYLAFAIGSAGVGLGVAALARRSGRVLLDLELTSLLLGLMPMALLVGGLFASYVHGSVTVLFVSIGVAESILLGACLHTLERLTR